MRPDISGPLPDVRLDCAPFTLLARSLSPSLEGEIATYARKGISLDVL